jgi:hypothetical protein
MIPRGVDAPWAGAAGVPEDVSVGRSELMGVDVALERAMSRRPAGRTKDGDSRVLQ